MADLTERSARLAKYINTITGGDVESILTQFAPDTTSLKELSGPDLEAAATAAKSLTAGDVIDSEEKADALERVIHLEGRPSRLVQDNWFKGFEGDFRYLTVNDAPSDHIRRVIKAVGRIDLPDRQGRDTYAGTGFIVGKNLVMTNRHVAEVFVSGVGQLNISPGESSELNMTREADREPAAGFRLKKCLMVHPYWDMALFRADLPGDLEPLSFSVAEPHTQIGYDVVVVGYPSFSAGSNVRVREIFDNLDRVKRVAPGRIVEKQLSIGSTWLRRSVDAMAHDCSTLRGSSGSALLEVESGLIAGLHFAGRYLIENYAVPGIELARDPRVVDMGVKFAKPIPPANPELDGHWADADPPNESQGVAEVGATTPIRIDSSGDSDGRSVTLEVPLRITVEIPEVHSGSPRFQFSSGGYFGTSATEATVNDYEGTAGEVDLGFWNIEWFTNRYRNKVADVAELVSDLKLDVWCFEEASPNATEELVDRLNGHHAGSYDFLAAEPNSSDGKQSNTIIWNTQTISCEKEAWGDELEPLFHLDSRDPEIDRLLGEIEAVHGKVFNRYPQIFACEAANGFDFRVVPLHLKARSEGSLRRRLASRILAVAVNKKIQSGGDADWVIGGDVNADLASGDFDNLVSGGFDAISASDEEDGGFTYIKRPYKSLIDHIFLSPNLSVDDSDEKFFIVAKDLQNPRAFLRNLSDHRPVIVRLSMASGEESALGTLLNPISKLG